MHTLLGKEKERKKRKNIITWSSFSSENVIEVNLYELFKRYSFTRKFRARFSCGLRASWTTDFNVEVVGVLGSDSKKKSL